MRTKSTLVKAVKFVNNCKFIFSFRKNIFQKDIFPILFCFITTISFAQSGSCNALLVVERNGNTRSTPPDGTFYSMILTNNGSSADTYILSAKNVNSSCSNPDGSSTSSNVVLNTDFVDSTKSIISEVTVNPGESVNFFIHITIPTRAAIQRWSCNQITATSKNCTNYSVDSLLHTLVIDPSND